VAHHSAQARRVPPCLRGFDPAIVARYRARDRNRLLADAGIIRNRLKVDAVIANAATVLELRESHGSFAGWLDAHHPLPKEEWVKLFKRTFRFTGARSWRVPDEHRLPAGRPSRELPGVPAHRPREAAVDAGGARAAARAAWAAG